MSPTIADLFCGAGGSSTGLVAAGFGVPVAANHSRVAIATHAANHPDTEHLCEDINKYDMRQLPRTQGLWASPICTEISPAGGRKRKRKQVKQQQELIQARRKNGEPEAFERTRATSYDVIRATEVHRYEFVLCENVLEWVVDWELFGWWRNGMHLLGYESQILSFNSAHVGDVPAPQWRDRVYVVFTRKGMRKPDLRLTPFAWCFECGQDVHAFQSWKNGNKVGKYRQQYDYRCPNARCRHAIVEPYVAPALNALDLTDLGTPIGSRKPTAAKPEGLAPSTMARIREGASRFYGQYMLNVNHDTLRAYQPDEAPLPARTVKIGEGIVSPPMQVPCGGSWNDDATSAFEPMRTRTASEMEGLAVPPSYITYLRKNTKASPTTEPMATFAAGGHHHALVIPYYRTGKAKSVRTPLDTVTTHDRFGLVHGSGDIDVYDFLFRMLKPREAMNAQGFPRDYIIHGNVDEQTAQAGNAVSVNVARWIGERVMEVLDS